MPTATEYAIAIAGHRVTIRPLNPSDTEIEAEFVRNLSDETRHFRFLGAVNELSAAELKRLCNIDGQHNMAFVATVREGDREREIGVSRYAQGSKPEICEMAVTVADAWQNKGLGRFLTRQLIDYARSHGVTRLYSVDFAENTAMQHLAHDLGMTVRRSLDDPTQVIYSLPL
jgi:RimJ/RimL family protein N-acetyltransferase